MPHNTSAHSGTIAAETSPNPRDVVVVGAARTPIGSFLGALADVSAPQLGGAAIAGAIAKAGVDPKSVEQVIMGQVLQAGTGQAPARQATLAAGLPKSVGATTLHKVCGSGMRAIMDGANGIRAGEWDTVVVGGMENMSQAPYLMQSNRRGQKMGHTQLIDSMIHDGLWDPYNDQHMGMCAELCAKEYRMDRKAQDAYALRSYQRAHSAAETGVWKDEIVPVSIPQRRGEPKVVAIDEEPHAANLDKMPLLRPAFDRSNLGTVTAANASTLNDGAAALVLMSRKRALECGRTPWAELLGHGCAAQEPEWFTTAPILSIRKLFERTGHPIDAIDLWEINEAFSVVPMAAIQKLGIDENRVNIWGGAVSLGHPIGASGARIVVTLLNALCAQKAKLGCASICIGGGEAGSLLVKNLRNTH